MVNIIISDHPFQEVGLTQAGAFWVFGGITVLTFFFCLLFVPETKGKSLDDIQQLFRSPRPYFLEIGIWTLLGGEPPPKKKQKKNFSEVAELMMRGRSWRRFTSI